MTLKMTPKQRFQQAEHRAIRQRAELGQRIANIQTRHAKDIVGYSLRRMGKRAIAKVVSKASAKTPQQRPPNAPTDSTSQNKSQANTLYPIILVAIAAGGIAYALRKPIIRYLFK